MSGALNGPLASSADSSPTKRYRDAAEQLAGLQLDRHAVKALRPGDAAACGFGGSDAEAAIPAALGPHNSDTPEDGRVSVSQGSEDTSMESSDESEEAAQPDDIGDDDLENEEASMKCADSASSVTVRTMYDPSAAMQLFAQAAYDAEVSTGSGLEDVSVGFEAFMAVRLRNISFSGISNTIVSIDV